MIILESDLVLIPARGGSKGVPGKNIKLLKGVPLIHYTLNAACELSPYENICVSSDSDEIIKTVEDFGVPVPFKRPSDLATDTSGTYEVILHALEYYREHDRFFKRLILLQPTSPLRNSNHIKEALSLYTADDDMVVSVKITKSNPYFNLFEEDIDGFLVKSKKGAFARRQDTPTIYEFNGAIYIINIESLLNTHILNFKKVKKYVMSEADSIDIDSLLDFQLAQMIIDKREQHDH